ncbi:glutaredoxin family protein [Rhodococcus sp. BP-252]|uniref:Thiol-disulfide isomerase n=1 Tax=Rhodococcoides kyotonense TaxID=398843 RepID=A0A177YCA3_9NOCA|nr:MULTISPECIES: glutaredoxin family protein [Rhodococcus]MBY6413639.1 glutaredoxin family protein [Rhodococcus sp. BP-320]MBY6418374.1 glutaredoxin family protein [Rhodococcus sp. BP-321]MBY6422499.1 glutaredoxin family protein [Rhodococcus sp. BP-324]MBY6428319.1 glutaredoxin family protein [Rhodococcus sp. BP-323]MBY6433496.1 glutaredoxin family protein [Rhodococcus sp. BP-322]
MESERTSVVLLTRAGCYTCADALGVLTALCAEHGLTVDMIDVDEAAATRPDLRAEYGDRVPVVLLDGREHSYWEVDEPRLRADLVARGHPKKV